MKDGPHAPIIEARCPLEAKVAVALSAAGIAFREEGEGRQRLDFYLPDQGVFIEVKAWHSPRICDQMASERNVIALQGPEAVAFFVEALSRGKA